MTAHAPKQPPAPPNFHDQRGRDCADALNRLRTWSAFGRGDS